MTIFSSFVGEAKNFVKLLNMFIFAHYMKLFRYFGLGISTVGGSKEDELTSYNANQQRSKASLWYKY